MILTEYFWKFQRKLHCGNIVDMPYWTTGMWKYLVFAAAAFWFLAVLHFLILSSKSYGK